MNPGATLLLLFSGSPVGTVTPTSLLAAIQSFWLSGGYGSSIAPLYNERAKVGSAYPFLVVDKISEAIPGPTEDDSWVHLWVSVHAGGSAAARTIGKQFTKLMSSPNSRALFTWNDPIAGIGGAEKFCERNERTGMRIELPQNHNELVSKFFMHLSFCVSGEA